MYKCIINFIHHFTFSKSIILLITKLLFQGKSLALILKKKTACFISFINIRQQACFIFLVKGVHIAEVKQIVFIVLCFRHTTNSSYSLYLKLFTHTFAKLNKYLCTWTIPSCTYSLLHQQKYWCSIILC